MKRCKIGRCLLGDLIYKHNLTQKGFAEEIGLTQQSVSRYINNQVIMSLETLVKVMYYFNCELHDIYELIEY